MTNEGITRLQIDRMVDGELSSAEQQHLLLACESDNRWRELALAYVESQVLESVLGKSMSLPNDSGNRLEAEADGGKVLAQLPNQQLHVPETRKHANHWNTWALAAAVLISLGVGGGLGWWWQDVEVGTPTNIAETSSPSGPSLSSRLAQQSGKSKIETMPFWVTDASGSEMRQVTLPLVNASDLSPNWQEELQRPNLPPDLVRELHDSGVKLRQQRTMVRVRRPDGRLVLVPIDYFYEELFQ